VQIVLEASVDRLYVLQVLFADGRRRRVDVESELWGEAFGPLRDPTLFSQVSVDPVVGTVVWPNGADFSPEFLHDEAAEAP